MNLTNIPKNSSDPILLINWIKSRIYPTNYTQWHYCTKNPKGSGLSCFWIVNEGWHKWNITLWGRYHLNTYVCVYVWIKQLISACSYLFAAPVRLRPQQPPQPDKFRERSSTSRACSISTCRNRLRSTAAFSRHCLSLPPLETRCRISCCPLPAREVFLFN